MSRVDQLTGLVMVVGMAIAMVPKATVAERGKVRPRTFHSPAVDMKRRFQICLPPGYSPKDDTRFPVMVLLHGLHGDESTWFESPKIHTTLDVLIASKAFPPVIAVSPNGNMDYWTNHYNAPKRRFGGYIAIDLVRHIDATYKRV